MKIPEIRIYFAWLLYDNLSKPFHKLYAKNSEKLATTEECEMYTEGYRTAWEPQQERILTSLCEALNVNFYKQVIDVPCAPWISIQSDPLIFNFYNEPDQFIDVLTHELCHVLLTDNTTYSINSTEREINLVGRWEKLFGESFEFNTLIHIPVHALSKYIYLDILRQPERLGRDVKDIQGYDAYQKAWEYVNENDYKQIIEKLKQDYAEIKKELAA